MTKKFFAKAAGWLGSAITAIAAAGQFGKYQAIALTFGTLLTGLGIHNASETSAGHPDGSSSNQKGFARFAAMVLLAVISCACLVACHHVNSTNPNVVTAVSLLDAENTVNSIAHGLLAANGAVKNLQATEPDYYTYVHPKLVQLAQLNDKANIQIQAAKNQAQQCQAVLAQGQPLPASCNVPIDWKTAVVAVGQAVEDPTALTSFGFKDPKSQQVVQLSFAALLSGISLASSYGGK